MPQLRLFPEDPSNPVEVVAIAAWDTQDIHDYLHRRGLTQRESEDGIDGQSQNQAAAEEEREENDEL